MQIISNIIHALRKLPESKLTHRFCWRGIIFDVHINTTLQSPRWGQFSKFEDFSFKILFSISNKANIKFIA